MFEFTEKMFIGLISVWILVNFSGSFPPNRENL